MARVKGTAVISSLAYLKERLGAEKYTQIFSGLSVEAQAALGSTILPSNWYEFSHLLELMKRAEVHLPRGAKSMAWEMGRYSAESGLSTVYKIFFRVADVSFILKKTAQVFSNYYDSGTMETVSITDKSALVSLRGFDQPSVHFCDRLLGWMERTVEMTGAKNVRMTHPRCIARGNDHCEYRGDWS